MFNIFKKKENDSVKIFNKEDSFNGDFRCLCVKKLCESLYDKDGIHRNGGLRISDKLIRAYFFAIPEPDHIDFEDVRICLNRPERLSEKISEMLARRAKDKSDNATV